MSIEEIASKMSKSDLDLWNELVAEVQVQVLQLEAIVPSQQTYKRTSSDSFRLKRVDTIIGVRRGPGVAYWNKIRSFGPGVIPTKDEGSVELAMGEYWQRGQKFSNVSEAALYLIDLLI
jgi:hypothetical protein